jgi:hypothetical protein
MRELLRAPSFVSDRVYRIVNLDADSRRLLDRIGSEPGDGIDRLVADLNRCRCELRPGTLLTREWDGELQQVRVVADGSTVEARGRVILSRSTN